VNLSRLSYFIVFVIAFLGIAGQWLGGELSSTWRYFTATFIFFLTIERILVFRNPNPILRILPKYATLGKRTKGEYCVTNKLATKLSFDSRELLPQTLSGKIHQFKWRIKPGQSKTFEFYFTPTVLGTYEWRHIYVRKLGSFGLSWWDTQLEQIDTTEITPEKFLAAEFNLGLKNRGNSQFNTVGSGRELVSLRDYQSGDPLRSIDWKATARRQKKVVRIYQEEQHIEIIIALDCGRTSNVQAGSLNNLGHNINIAARLAEKAILNDDHVAFISFADQVKQVVPLVKGHRGLRQIRQSLQKVSPSHQESNLLATLFQIRRLVKHRCLVVILTDIAAYEIGGPLAKTISLLTPKHLPIIASIMDEQLIDLSTSHAENWLDPYRIDAARESIKQIDRSLLNLRKLGAAVVVTSPDQIDSAVLNYYDRLRNRHQI